MSPRMKIRQQYILRNENAVGAEEVLSEVSIQSCEVAMRGGGWGGPYYFRRSTADFQQN